MVNLSYYSLLLVLVCLVMPVKSLECSSIRRFRSVCSDILNITQAYGQILDTGPIGSDDINTFVLASALSPPVPDTCVDFLVHLLCIVSTPPCNPDTGLPVLICEDDCTLYKQIQEAGFCDVIQERVNMLEMITTFIGFDVFSAAYYEFNCYDPKTYFFMNVTFPDTSSCTSLFSPETRETFQLDLCELGIGPNCTVGSTATEIMETESDYTLLLAVLPPVVLVLLAATITLLLLILTCYFRHRRRKLSVNPETAKETKVGRTSNSYFGQQNEIEQKNKFGRQDEVGGVKVGGVVEHDAVIAQYKETFAKITIPHSYLTMGDIIGQGSFSKVFEGKLSSSDATQAKKVAVKVLKISELKSFLIESTVMRDFSHPNVLGLVGVVFDTPDATPHLVLPFMENGNLKNFLKSRRKSSSSITVLPQDLHASDLVRMCVDVVHGMEYLARKKFVHRDLAARNCMLDEDLQVKVGDFGLSRDVYASDYYRTSDKSAKLPVKWMPPETFNDGISNEKTDVWAFGVTCWEVFSLGRAPYPTVPNLEMFNYISDGGRLDKPDLCPKDMFDVMGRCWEHRPEDRPSFTDLSNILSEYWDNTHGYIT